jgi:hypothetical protein
LSNTTLVHDFELISQFHLRTSPRLSSQPPSLARATMSVKPI